MLSPFYCHRILIEAPTYSCLTFDPKARMDYFRRFTFLFAAPAFDANDLEGVRFNQIVGEIERSGFEVIRAHKLDDAEIAVKTNAAIGCMMVDWAKKALEAK